MSLSLLPDHDEHEATTGIRWETDAPAIRGGLRLLVWISVLIPLAGIAACLVW